MPSYAKEQLRKIFVGGLSLQTTEEGMKEYFSRWGECVDVVVMRYPDSRRSRGFGFVTFENVSSVDAVLDAKPHILDGKDIEPKRAIAKEETGRSSSSDAERSRKVFVGGLASSTTEEDVRECFTNFCEEVGNGKVEEVMLLKDKENQNRLRGFCFVIFDCDEIVDKVCSVKYFEIRTKTVEVRRAESRQVMRKKEEKESGYKRRSEESFSKREMDSPRGNSFLTVDDFQNVLFYIPQEINTSSQSIVVLFCFFKDLDQEGMSSALA